jgi:RNA polymerase sigma-70 factor (family 1)
MASAIFVNFKPMQAMTDMGGEDAHSPYGGMEAVFRRYYSKLFYFAYKIIESKASAEDVVQDVFLRFQDRLPQFNSETALGSFLYLSVKNACLNLLRHRAVEAKHEASVAFSFEEEASFLENLIRAEVYGEIHQAIQSLPAGCRTVINFAYFDGLKNEEIANRLQVSVNTVKTQKQRGLQLLRLRLGPDAFFLLFTVLNA